jgi:hypothetical protein
MAAPGVAQAAAAAAQNPLPQILVGLQQANAQANQNQVDMRAEALRDREKKDWLIVEVRKVSESKGLPETSMRKWARRMIGAMGRVPQAALRGAANADQTSHPNNSDPNYNNMTVEKVSH